MKFKYDRFVFFYYEICQLATMVVGRGDLEMQ